ncbi:GntR family transcriptional regulator [Aliidongia dinghuensis]|uniref:GntR family transcriptional regulator n=1 Tax=Aliidongia dinghuensis TaxID=1867774 RepID=A0A8J2YZ73_9PROT|nr:transcriptional regulator NanR [Aliidongia dinghuensis]GGF44858.1 GntR family transcriptional regulator [Aliidongia dinghuensis]
MSDSASPETIVRRKLSHEVFDRLRAMITSGDLAPGDAMPSERDLMDRFGVGRPAIREAMQALANMGLITITHGERARVRLLTAKSIFQQVDLSAHMLLSASPDSLEHLKQARSFFERGMVREAAMKATEADIERLGEALERQRASVEDVAAFVSADMRFHTCIAAISRNPIFEAVSEAMLGWLREYRTDLLIWSGKQDRTLAEHQEILDHIREHDPDGAEAAMIRHLDRSSALYSHRG